MAEEEVFRTAKPLEKKDRWLLLCRTYDRARVGPACIAERAGRLRVVYTAVYTGVG